ncbi:MAG: COG1361 S-layer family protein, partial [Euryarchaeota archaeon]|nr:COG1361 S-layer family protein [Euryarchaeota archaeon]
MTQNTANQLQHLFVLAILTSAIMVTPASAAGGALKVDITRYEPYPAEIGKYVDLWVSVKNTGGGTAEDVTIELVPKYPFTLDSSNNARQNKGSIGTDASAMYEYRLFVADDAKPGTHEITIRYQGEKGATWSEKDFVIKVGTDTLDSRGTLKLEAITTDPEVLIPGDAGTVTLTLINTASQYSVTINGKDYDTNAQLNEVELIESDGIVVTTDSYRKMGVLGPDDSIDLSFNIMVGDDTDCGTEHLQLTLTGSSHTYNAKWDIPIKVETAGIKIIPSKPLKLACDRGKIEFDVANTHSSTFTSVSIEPQA